MRGCRQLKNKDLASQNFVLVGRLCSTQDSPHVFTFLDHGLLDAIKDAVKACTEGPWDAGKEDLLCSVFFSLSNVAADENEMVVDQILSSRLV